MTSGTRIAADSARPESNKNQYTPAESKGSGYDSLKLAANGFKTNGDTKIVIKGTLNGKEITIEYTFTAK